VGNEIQALGGQTVNLSTTQVAVAMQSGTVSAALASAAFASSTLKGIIHGYLDAGTFQYGPYFMFVNLKSWQALGTKLQNEVIAAVSGPINNYLTTIDQQQEVSDQTLASQGDWVVKATPAQVTQFAQQLQPTALAGFKTEDPASYAALIATVKAQGITLYSGSSS
jgi:TRAP-type C4-dicarboxylate transport system substrate-binding protein